MIYILTFINIASLLFILSSLGIIGNSTLAARIQYYGTQLRDTPKVLSYEECNDLIREIDIHTAYLTIPHYREEQ